MTHITGWRHFALAVSVVMFGLAVAGLSALAVAHKWWIPIPVLAGVAVAALPDAWKAKVLEVLGAVLVATAALVGVNAMLVDPLFRLFKWFDDGSPLWTIFVGLVFATAVFAAAALWYLRSRGHWKWPPAVAVGCVSALVFVVGLPIVLPPILGHSKPKREAVVEAKRVVSQLDVLIVADPPRRSFATPAFEPKAGLGSLDIRYSVGFATDKKVRWTLVNGKDEEKAIRALAAGGATASSTPALRDDADHVLVLLVDATPAVTAQPAELPDAAARADEIGRWQKVRRSVAGHPLPTFALLQTTSRRRLERWRDHARQVRAISVQKLASPTVTDAAVRLGVAAPTSREDFALALRHRPVLLFDAKEPVPRPLSVEGLFADGKVRQCGDGGDNTHCSPKPITDSSKLENGGTRLELDLPKSSSLRHVARKEEAALRKAAATQRGQISANAASPLREGLTRNASPPGSPPPGTPPPSSPTSAPAPSVAAPGVSLGRPLSTIYVHATSREVNGRHRLYLDYWWYLPDNPARAGFGAFCGAGLVIPGISCFNHQSDWEGITVIVDRTEKPKPVAVHYAQHDKVVRYEWSHLRKHWAADKGLVGLVRPISDVGERPLVFVARGTHASYATPCTRRCRQLAHDLEEKPHSGTFGWLGNYTGACGTQSGCLNTLPTRIGGTQPALWNAFEGPWGKRRCIFTYYCDSSTPPPAPGRQGRYQHPGRYHGVGNFRNRKRPFEPGEFFDE